MSQPASRSEAQAAESPADAGATSPWMRLAGAPLVPFATLSAVGLPAGVAWANWFALLNAISWSIILGSPLILYARHLGAGAAVLGLLAALPPLLVVLHIPGAYLMPHLGYRRTMVAGWAARTAVIFLLVATAFLFQRSTWFGGDNAFRLAGVFACIAVFSFVRGLAGGAWMPWMTALVPEDVRGKFFLRDQLYGQGGNLLATAVACAFLLGSPPPWRFGLLFCFAGCGGVASVLCLRRMPEIPTTPHHQQAAAHAPLAAMLRNATFRNLCAFNVFYMLAIGALGVFTVSFLRGPEHFSQSSIVLLSGMAIIGGIISLFWCGRVLDRVGSRPIMAASLVGFVLIFLGWFAVAAHMLRPTPAVIGVLYLVTGVAGLNFSAANNRLQSFSIPLQGRNHYFAVFQVAANGAAGLSPLVWGLVLWLIGHRRAITGPMEWNRYSFFFACGFALTAALLATTRVALRE